jgi:mannose-6-phosphate isomerase-like protein (cupin superfamily)
MQMRIAYSRLLVICGFCCIIPVWSQSRAEFPRTPWGGYPYPASYDAEIADPDVHRVLFENEHVMFLEVANPPELDVKMHGHPYPSVFARDTGAGPITASGPTRAAGIPLDDTHLEPGSPFAGKGWGEGGPPAGFEFPRCTTAPPEGPHRPLNHNTVPVHFYRIEFRRLDADGLAAHWKEWYPGMLKPGKAVRNLTPGPALGPNFSEDWPYSRLYDSVLAAPDNYQLLYEDSHVRLLEVSVRPGETTPIHGHPYASVLAFDAVVDPRDIVDTKLDPNSPLNGQGAGHGPAPSMFNMTAPTCTTVGAQAPHSIRNKGIVLLHYYRIEFKRVDGEALRSHWQDWYPWMKYMRNMR